MRLGVGIHRLADWVMLHRAERLARRLGRHLSEAQTVADIGSGTGHNGALLRGLLGKEVAEFDVADLHWVGPGPAKIENGRIPVGDRGVDAVLLLFVLQYPADLPQLLAEVRRVSRKTVIVLQATYRYRWGRLVLTIREFVWGRFALQLAKWAGLVTSAEATMRPYRLYTREELLSLLEGQGFRVVSAHPAEWPGLCVSRDLFVLEPQR